jgi:hypothetical protein
VWLIVSVVKKINANVVRVIVIALSMVFVGNTFAVMSEATNAGMPQAINVIIIDEYFCEFVRNDTVSKLLHRNISIDAIMAYEIARSVYICSLTIKLRGGL